MSLTSRVFGLFSTTATSDPATSDSPTSIPQTKLSAHNGVDVSAIRHAPDRHMLDEEEEPRPPYLHVRICITHTILAIQILTVDRQCWPVELEVHVVIC
jgi:hypothetical protein